MGYSSTIESVGNTTRNKPRRVLITGAAGSIGSYIAEPFSRRYALRRMVHHGENAASIASFGEVIEGDITDLEQMKRACDGMDTVVHLAAAASPDSTWDKLLPLNIIGAYNTFTAAKSCGVERVIFASSIHAISGYPADVQVKTHEPVNPRDLYGVSKCLGEALARYMAEQEGLRCIVLRIGAFQPPDAARSEHGVELLDAFVSRRDMAQLIERCIDAERIRFAIFHGLSDNRLKRMDFSDARELVGYAPIDDAARLNESLRSTGLPQRIKSHSLADGDYESGLRNQV
jgi:NAD(P)-dependent dehydrogenase (short-subunit alcohol dehydrogenase family)